MTHSSLQLRSHVELIGCDLVRAVWASKYDQIFAYINKDGGILDADVGRSREAGGLT